MHISQRTWNSLSGWTESGLDDGGAQLVLAFGGRNCLEDRNRLNDVRKFFPASRIVWCSTAGEIAGTAVSDDALVVTAVRFERTQLAFAQTTVTSADQSESAGASLAKQLNHEGLKHVMVFSDGLKVNGTSLVRGLTRELPTNVSLTGGLVGDGSSFQKTLVSLDEDPKTNNIVIIGFYGESLRVGYGSLGGWDPFGPKRVITKAVGNVLYELDGKPALALYKEYLGELASKLPSSGLLFPLRISVPNSSEEVVRTILAVDESAQSVTFAGDMPQGTSAQMMKANFDRLIEGASGAASLTMSETTDNKPELAVLISCIGRKLVLKERTEEELEAVQEVVGPQATLTGFYSYGEICPVSPTERQCQLHNQTMTITTFSEA